MATPINPKTLRWVDPTSAKDQNGQTVAWDVSDRAGISIKFDGAGVVSVPAAQDVKSFDLRSLAAYQSLPIGSHTLGLAVVTKEGVTGDFSGDVPFLVGVVPAAPSAVELA